MMEWWSTPERSKALFKEVHRQRKCPKRAKPRTKTLLQSSAKGSARNFSFLSITLAGKLLVPLPQTRGNEVETAKRRERKRKKFPLSIHSQTKRKKVGRKRDWTHGTSVWYGTNSQPVSSSSVMKDDEISWNGRPRLTTFVWVRRSKINGQPYLKTDNNDPFFGIS